MSWHSRVIAATALAFTLAAFGVAVSRRPHGWLSRTKRAARRSSLTAHCTSAVRATPKLSVFSGYTFRNGTCKRSVVAGDPAFVLELGALKPGSRTNGRLSYLKIEIYGPLLRPTSGQVISWHNGKRWSGYGKSFKGNARGGTFVVTRTASGEGRETGSYRC